MFSGYDKGFPTIRRRLSLLLATFSVGFFAATSAHAATYYVATNGSDSAAGSQASPFKTVQKAVGMVRAGDTVIIKPGRHPAFALNNINGAAGAPITFFGEPGAIIDRNLGGGNGLRNIEFYGGSYITIDGLELTDSDPMPGPLPPPGVKGNDSCVANRVSYGGRQGIKINKKDGRHAHHLIFKNLHAYHLGNTAILGLADDVQVLHNHFHDLGDKRRYRQAYGVYLKGARWLIRGNRIYNANGNGIRTGNDPREGGPVHNLLLDSIIENNIVYNNGGLFSHPSGPTGCRYKDGGDGIVVWHGSGNIIRNNIIYDHQGSGIRIGEDFALNNKPNLVYNNTVYKNRKDGIGCERTGTKTIVKNNISYLSGKADINGNCTNQLSNNLTTDPKFVNAGSGDFGIQAGSPAIDKGMTLAEVKDDFTGKKRPEGAAYDIGAFEGAGSKKDVLPDMSAVGFLPGGAGGIGGGGDPLGLGHCLKY